MKKSGKWGARSVEGLWVGWLEKDNHLKAKENIVLGKGIN